MMTEESANPECCGLIENKLLQGKVKRTRQRVDAGEPRNSYSSIPNFSSRPSFLSSGLYSAIFNSAVHDKHFGLFGPGFAPAKMLNELLNRQVGKTGSETSCDSMITVDSPNTEGKMNLDCFKAAALHHGLPEDARPSAELAHNMLRDILQGRKKELMALENELRSVSANGVKQETFSLDNNNSINNNNNNLNNNNVKLEYSKGAISDGLDGDGKADAMSVESENGNADSDNSMGDDSQGVAEIARPEDGSNVVRVKTEDGISIAASDSESVSSPMSDTKDDHEIENSFPKSPDRAPKVGMDMKRARVENIVSTMRSSPTPMPVNGCKKRKLYHPQQHDSSAAERYTDNCLISAASNDNNDSDNEGADPSDLKLKLVEKNALKSQLRTMQEQLAEMQHKYVQLCSRMDIESETQEVEDNDPEADADTDVDGNSDTETPKKVSVGNPVAPVPAAIPQPPAMPPHMLLPGLPMMQPQHMPHAEHPSLNYPQHSFSNAAAAMYLGVNHKLFFDQESRMKESEQRNLQQKHEEMKQHQHKPHGPHPLGPHHGPPPPHHLQNLQNEMHQRLQPKRPSSEFSERLSMFRNQVTGIGPVSGSDLEGLADVLKTEITSSLTNLIDTIVSRFVHQRRLLGKQTEAASVAAEQLNKDLLLASQMLDRKSPRTKVTDRTNNTPMERINLTPGLPPKQNTPSHQPQQQLTPTSIANSTPANTPNSESAAQCNGLPIRPSPSNGLFHTPKLPGSSTSSGMNPAAAAALYSSISNMQQMSNPLCMSSESRDSIPEQNEALSLVVAPKKKRHKVTDTRITPRTVSRILAQDSGPSPSSLSDGGKPFGGMMGSGGSTSGADSPPPPQLPPRPYHPPTMLPVSLPTSVAIPNPSLHESQVFSPYSPFFHQHPGHHLNGSPPGVMDHRDSPPLPNPPTMLHPALLAAAHHSAHSATPDYVHFRNNSSMQDCGDRGSEGNTPDGHFDGMQPSISFYSKQQQQNEIGYSSTLTPMHLRKAKLMFFWVRYPSSAVLKMYFPDIMFNKNNTAQLVKWFSNFREFYYIQMEKYARQAVSEGIKMTEDIHVNLDSEIYRVLNLHYNRNNHIEVPSTFRFVVEQTLREFFKAIQSGKDTEQSWKKSIYKIISRLDDPVPDYFKSPNFLEQLE